MHATTNWLASKIDRFASEIRHGVVVSPGNLRANCRAVRVWCRRMSYDIVRHHPMTYDVVRCLAQCEHRFTIYMYQPVIFTDLEI